MKYIQYNDFLNNYSYYFNNEIDKKIFVGKINGSYLVGPIISEKKGYNTLYKRIKSNCIYDISLYKKVSDKKAKILVDTYINQISEDTIIEIKNGKVKIHKLVDIPENGYEK